MMFVFNGGSRRNLLNYNFQDICGTICQQNQLKGIENASPAELGDIWKSSETSILSRVMRKGVK